MEMQQQENGWWESSDRQSKANRIYKRIALFKLARAIAVGDESTWNELPAILAVACAHKLQKYATPEQIRQALAEVMAPDGPDAEWAIFYESALREIFAMEAVIEFVKPNYRPSY